ncbi:hypothetical protein PAEPH01_1958 [Pancytospora epiphaga]|nr:hypothetical protein PAEPH01_1958 [Pancytospora epiphaga]
MTPASQTTMKRLMKEYETIVKSNLPHISAAPIDDSDMYKWQAIIFGPENSIYAGGVFKLSIVFPPDYPFKPPRVEFLTKIYHCNIVNKYLCIDILKTQWSPALTVDKVLLSIVSLLLDPNPKDPLNKDAADKFINDRKEYNRIAQEWTKRYATEAVLNGEKGVETNRSM